MEAQAILDVLGQCHSKQTVLLVQEARQRHQGTGFKYFAVFVSFHSHRLELLTRPEQERSLQLSDLESVSIVPPEEIVSFTEKCQRLITLGGIANGDSPLAIRPESVVVALNSLWEAQLP